MSLCFGMVGMAAFSQNMGIVKYTYPQEEGELNEIEMAASVKPSADNAAATFAWSDGSTESSTMVIFAAC